MTAAQLAEITRVAAAVLGPTEAHVTLSTNTPEDEVMKWAELLGAEVRKHVTLYMGEAPRFIFFASKTIGTVEFTVQGSRPATWVEIDTLGARVYHPSEKASLEDLKKSAASKLDHDIAQLSSSTQRSICGAR